MKGKKSLDELPIIVSIQPGIANEKPLLFMAPEEATEWQLKDVIKYVKSEGDEIIENREDEAILSRIQRETTSDYQIVIKGEGVSPESSLKDYLEVKSLEDGRKYYWVEMIVAAPQEGGF